MVRIASILLLLTMLPAFAVAQESAMPSLERDFEHIVAPLLQSHCVSCHDTETQEAQLDLTAFKQLRDVAQSHRVWATLLERVEAGEMPPEEAELKLTNDQRESVVHWIRRFLQFEAQRNAGDPGPVIARRLSNAEYDYSVRDLTGVDIRPTRTFPVDPANEAGFDNSGESLSMSPALMTKYLEAARTVVDHLVTTPQGIRFAPHPVVTDTDRDKYCVKRIVEFYQRQPTDYAEYFLSAWKYQNRALHEDGSVSLAQVADECGVSAKYLGLVWQAVSGERIGRGPLAKLQAMWHDLPPEESPERVREACRAMRDFVVQTRRQFEPKIDNLHTQGVHKGSQPFVLWKNDQYAKYRRSFSLAFLDADPQGLAPEDASLVAELERELNEGNDREQVLAAYEKFCSVFPDTFYVSERGRDYLDIPRSEQEKGRLLSAGFHSMMGYYRDDQPLYDLILDEAAQKELDELWQELDFFAAAPLRQYQGFLWFDRTDSQFMRDEEFDFARPEDQTSLTQEKIEKLSEVFLAKAARNGGKEVPLQAIRDFFTTINRQIRWVEQTRIAAEPKQLDAVIALASRAYRRPLLAGEESDLRDYYHHLRNSDALPHEEALQDSIVSILMSPHFLYRVDLLADSDESRPLNDIELASRLSYFLWSSLPDKELMQHALSGDLHVPEVLLAQTRRMLSDQRIDGMAKEFAGNWLDFRRFEQHNSVDRERFPNFDDELRLAMFEEPLRFFVNVVQEDRSCMDFLFANHTFVNATLAEHYGMQDLDFEGEEWKMVTEAGDYGRGGLLPMSVFLTKNAPGLRTSPVKRGYWVVRNLLGERIPPPPPDVPDLPNDESKLGDLTLIETLAKHREHESCAGCHNRIDSFGVVFEGFGPVGERRALDLGGRPVQQEAIFPDGSQRHGVDELSAYLRKERAGDFVGNLHRKLLSYALGRTLLLSDESLIRQLQTNARDNEYRFGELIETIVTSPQFLNKRGRQASSVAVHGESQ